jgi:aminoglycoside phosphotransferase family enzyme/predicted kinase
MNSPAAHTDQLGDPDRQAATDPALLEALAASAMYQGSPPVAVHETHASWVFVAGERAYKIKKPVGFAFLDYSTLSRRHEACSEEVRVNQHLAPGIYLGVRAIVRTPDGFRLADEDAAGAVEYAVEMLSFDEADTLEGMIAAGALTPDHIQDVARRLASFHCSAPALAGGSPGEVLEGWRVNVQELSQLAHPARWHMDVAARFGEAFVRAHGAEIEQRVRDGLVREGHGDLRCEHVLVRGPVRVVDRIEFDPALRCTDVASDLAFLTMDLEAHGQRWAARELASAYRRAGASPGSEALASFYAAYRALVRVKTTLLYAAGHEPRGASSRLQRAERLWALAERLCWRARRPLAIVVCGPPASGKSMLAAELSRVSEMPVVSSDVVRKRLAGIPAVERARPEHYSDEFTRATYDRLAGDALRQLSDRDGVIVDATCGTPSRREALLARLERPGATQLVVHCQTTLEMALQRAAERMQRAERVSDATPEIVAQQFRGFEPPDELPEGSVLTLSTSLPLDLQTAKVAHALDERLTRAVEERP